MQDEIDSPGRSPELELLSVAQMGEADRLAIAGGTPGSVLMEAAGAAVARAAIQLAPEGAIAVLCGPGNNGGDGFVAARLLVETGREVRLFLLGERDRLKGDAARAARLYEGSVAPAAALDLSDCALVIDALFGAGLARDVDGLAAELVGRINAWRKAGKGRVLAVDVPSGLDGDTGQRRGACIEADATVTFFRLKPGHLLKPGRGFCGAVELADIGIPPAVLETVRPQAFRNEPALWRAHLPQPREDWHKYARGHVLVVSGGMMRTGAARLAARAALRAGAGLVTIASPTEALAVNAAHLTAIMLAPCDAAADLSALLADRRTTALVIGPAAGVGAATRDKVLAALAAGLRTIILDADALTTFAGEARALGEAIAASEAQVLLTPHEGEFARLFACEPDVLGKASKHERARAASALTGAVVLLKGPDTVVAAPTGRASILGLSSPFLATAGSGDVLAGLCAGLAAQGVDLFAAASAGVWLHACAGANLGQGLIAEDLPEALPEVLATLARDQR